MVDAKVKKPNGNLVLESVSIQNLATFENQTFNFHKSFTAIIGETGSGKSLVLDAIQLLLGSRSDKKLIRKGSTFASVEGVFSFNDPQMKKYFNDIGFPTDDDFITIKRIVYSTGKSKAYLNYHSCSVSALTTFSRTFIDLVGQFENQKLLSPDYHLSLLDSFSSNQNQIKNYKQSWDDLVNLRVELQRLEHLKAQQEREQDFINYQIDLLNQLEPSKVREEELIRTKEKITSIRDNQNAILEATNLLTDTDRSAVNSIQRTISSLSKIEHINDKVIDNLITAKELLEDSSFELSKECNNDYSDEEFDSIIDELDGYQKLKRKFKCNSTEELVNLYQDLNSKIETFAKLDFQIEATKEKLVKIETTTCKIAEELSKKRKSASVKLSEALTKFVQGLNMKGATLKISLITEEEIGPNGFDRVSFLAETNPGEGFYKIKDIASGGELSRILLALRSIIASNDSISIFLFDEIDTGIGGETAVCIGKALEKVSKHSQVISITHLPQIAGFANELLSIFKEVSGTNKEPRTASRLKHIIGSDRMEALEQMSPQVH